METQKVLGEQALAHLVERMRAEGGGGVREDPEISPEVMSGALFPDMPPSFNIGLIFIYAMFASAYDMPSKNIWQELADQENDNLTNLMRMLDTYLEMVPSALTDLVLGDVQTYKEAIGEAREGYVLPIEQDVGRLFSILDTVLLGYVLDQFFEYAGGISGMSDTYEGSYPSLCNAAAIHHLAMAPAVATAESAGIVKPDGKTLNVTGDGTLSVKNVHVSKISVDPYMEDTLKDRNPELWSAITSMLLSDIQSGSLTDVVKAIFNSDGFKEEMYKDEFADFLWSKLIYKGRSLASDSEFITALANNQTFIDALVAKLPVVSTTGPGLAPQIPEA